MRSYHFAGWPRNHGAGADLHFHLLAGAPRVYDELRAEVSRTLNGRPATFADLPNLPHADAVVRETLRLYPPAWAIGREAAKPCRIAGLDLSPRDQIWLAQWVVHRDARWFPEPDAFKPERWRDDSAKQLPRSAYFRSVEALASASATPSR